MPPEPGEVVDATAGLEDEAAGLEDAAAADELADPDQFSYTDEMAAVEPAAGVSGAGEADGFGELPGPDGDEGPVGLVVADAAEALAEFTGRYGFGLDDFPRGAWGLTSLKNRLVCDAPDGGSPWRIMVAIFVDVVQFPYPHDLHFCRSEVG